MENKRQHMVSYGNTRKICFPKKHYLNQGGDKVLPNQTQITTDSKRTSRTISLANVLPTNIIVCNIIRRTGT